VVSSRTVYCEMCGRPIDRRVAKIVYIEGAKLILCPNCYAKVSRRVTTEVKSLSTKGTLSRRPSRSAGVTRRRREVLDEYEVVPDFAERVRRAREKLGWTQRMLAEAVKEGENVIKRIESGRLVPTIDLARRLERVLGIKLLEPVVESTLEPMKSYTSSGVSKELTLGDIVAIRKKERKER